MDDSFLMTEAMTDNPVVEVSPVGEFTTQKIGCEAPAQTQLSKRQQKRIKKKEKWLANLPEKRAKERMKLKLRRREARANNVSLGPSRKELKRVTMANSKNKLTLVLDFSFDHLMDPKDIAKCIKQVQRCYCCNRRVTNPVQFHIANMNGKSREELKKLTGYENWDVNIHSEKYQELFQKEKLVYLTSESDNVIENVSEEKIYIIGALVDHNSQKGLCFNLAKEEGIEHGRLPIAEYLDMKSRKVLAINHVFEIMARVSNGLSWKDAMLIVMPQRKGAIAKDEDNSDHNENSDLSSGNVNT